MDESSATVSTAIGPSVPAVCSVLALSFYFSNYCFSFYFILLFINVFILKQNGNVCFWLLSEVTFAQR